MASVGAESDAESNTESDFFGEIEERTGLNKYFQVKSRTNQVHCTIRDCKTIFKTWKSSNLKRHLKTSHASYYAKLYPNQIDEVKRLQIMALELQLDAVELVTVNGQQFALLNASAIRGFCDEKLKTLRAKRYRVDISRSTIARNVDEISKELVEILKKEMKDQDICLMLDTCTKGTLSVLSINARFVNSRDEVITRSLGIIELTHRHTAVEMATKIRDYIEKTFNISIRQVKAVVTDNAANMVLTRKLLNKLALGESISAYEDEDEVDEMMGEDEMDFAENEPSEEDQLEIADIINNDDNFSGLIATTAREFSKYYGAVITVNPISCSTHTLQLAIKDSLVSEEVNRLISKVNRLAITLRNQIVVVALKQLGIKITKPPLKNVTRWNSDYLLVSFLNEYLPKSVCIKINV